MSVRTTTAGWFPKPVELSRARWRHAEGDLDDAALAASEIAATDEALGLQQALGIDLLVEGQLDRADMVSHFGDRLDGLEVTGFVRCFGNRYYRKPVVTGEIGWPGPITVEAWRRAAGVASKPVRAIVTGPYTMMDWSFDEHYGSRERVCLAFAGALAREVAALAEAGATEIEIDEPAISARPEELDLATRALGQVTAALGGRARSWTHVAYGELGPVLEKVLRLPVDVLMLELTDAGDELIAKLGELPADKQLGAGVLDVLDPEVESVELLRGRLERVARVVPRERLWALPDAGLRTLSRAALEAKLANLVAAARSL